MHRLHNNTMKVARRKSLLDCEMATDNNIIVIDSN